MKKQVINSSELTGRQKAAVLLMSMDLDVAAKVFKELEMKEVEQIAVEISHLRDLPPDVVEESFKNFMN